MTPRLGDQFPSQIREDFCKRNLIRGAVLRAHTEETVPPKIKLFVVWGLEESLDQIGVSFINSEIKSIKSPRLQALQHPLLSKNNPFLIHDSFLECSRIYEKNLKVVRGLLMANSEVFLGNISPEDLLAAEKIIGNASTIEEKLKKRYGFI
jgi:hypothetical protein